MSSLIDRYGRKLDYLRISVTDRCNLRCIYCKSEKEGQNEEQKEILIYEEIVKIVEAATSLGIKKIRITGGEPLVRKKIIYLLEALAKIVKIEDFSLTTNGVFLSDYVNELKKVGIKRINISLDTLDREKYKFITGKDVYSKVLSGVHEALVVGLNPVKLNVVVMRGINDNEVTEFANLTYDEPLHVRFIEFMPIGHTSYGLKDKFISNDEVKERCQSLGELAEERNHQNGKISPTYRFKNAKGVVSFISPISKPFCSTCSRLRLTSDGKLRLCLGTPDEINLKQIIRSKKYSLNTLKQVFIVAANKKPKGHCFNAGTHAHSYKTMCQIGG